METIIPILPAMKNCMSVEIDRGEDERFTARLIDHEGGDFELAEVSADNIPELLEGLAHELDEIGEGIIDIIEDKIK